MFYVNAESPPVGDNITSSAVYEEVSSDTLTSSSPLPDSAQVLTNDPASTVAQSVSGM